MNRAPTTTPTDAALERAAGIAREFVAGLPDRPVAPTVPLDELRRRFGGPLPEAGKDPVDVVEELAANAEGGLVASAGPRYFGFVIGGGVPAALAADWLTSAWDQNAGLYVIGPAAAVAEETAGAWLAELFGLPAGVERRVHHRRDDGLVHRARRRAPRAPRPAGLGRRAPGPVRGAGDPGRRERRVARHDLRGPPDAGHGPGPRDPRRDRRPGPDARRRACARPSPRSTGRRSCARRPATSTPAASTRCRRSSRRSAATAAGSTSTARSACGRPPIPRGGTSSRGSGTPTRGRPTPTSGSTCPTTPASSFVRDPAAHHAAMTLGRRVLRRDDRRRARRVQLGARVVAPRPRVRRLGGAPPARPVGARRADRPRRRTTPGGSPRGSTARPGPASSTTSSSTRSSSGSRTRLATSRPATPGPTP